MLILLEGQSDVITFGGRLSPLSQMPHSGDNYYYSFFVFNIKKINSLINVIINFSSLKPFCIQSCHSCWSLMYIALGNQSLYLYFYDNMMGGEGEAPPSHVNVADLKNYSGLCELHTYVCHISVCQFKAYRSP